MSKRLEQEGVKDVFYIDYGRMSEIDDGRRVFYDHAEWLRTITLLKAQKHRLHRILPNCFGCTLPSQYKSRDTASL